jgi:predicted kinase
MLIVFAGLPGSGKTTVARALALRLGATYLRIDTIEQAVRDAGLTNDELGAAGYLVAYAVAEANLGVGQRVVADCVNPLAVTRQAWHEVALRAGARIVDIEVVCGDAEEHRRRVETRTPDIAGLALPTWEQVVVRLFEPWVGTHCVLDTAVLGVEEAVAAAERYVREQEG